MNIMAVNAEMSEHDLGEIYALLQLLDNAPTQRRANQRLRQRSACRFAGVITLLALSARPEIRIVTRNVSTTGFSFLCTRPFAPGEMFALCLPACATTRKALLCAAKFCRYVHKGKHEIGAEFLEAAAVEHHDPQIPKEWIMRATAAKPKRPVPAKA